MKNSYENKIEKMIKALMVLPIEQRIITIDKDTIKLYGKKCSYYQMVKFKEEITPVVYIVNSKEKFLVSPYYYPSSVISFNEFLEKGIEEFNK